MSDSKEKKNPWAKHLAKHGAVTPPPEPPAPPPAAPPRPPVADAAAPRSPVAGNPWTKALSRSAVPTKPPANLPANPAPPASPPPEKILPAPPANSKRTTARDVFRKMVPAPRAATSRAAPPVSATPAAVASPATSTGAKEQVSDELAAALTKLAIEYAPLPVTNAPFVSAQEREQESRERRRERRVWLFKRVAAAAGVIGVLLALSSLVLFRTPSDEALAEAATKAAQIALAGFSSNDRPLQIDTAEAVLSDTFGVGHLRYFAEVTLRLREPLYGPAATNGTATYRQLQQSLGRARQRDSELSLLPLNDGPKPPELPRLIQVLHHAGEPLIVRLPFEARKFGWSWRLDPPQRPKEAPGGRVDGLPLNRFEREPYLIFGPPDTIEEVRRRTVAAREYILAVAKAAQVRGSGGTRESAPRSEAPAIPAAPSDASSLPVADRPAVNLNVTAVPGLQPGFDPDKPAVAPEKPGKPD